MVESSKGFLELKNRICWRPTKERLKGLGLFKGAVTSVNIALPQRSLRSPGHHEEVSQKIIQVTHPTS